MTVARLMRMIPPWHLQRSAACCTAPVGPHGASESCGVVAGPRLFTHYRRPFPGFLQIMKTARLFHRLRTGNIHFFMPENVSG